MPITINEGGVLYELDTVTSNEGGVLYELDTVHANDGGVLHEIHSAASFPDSLTWKYTGSNGTTTRAPTVSNNGLTVSNSRSEIACNHVTSSVFEIKGTVKITVSFSHEKRYSNGSGGCGITDESTGESVGGFTLTSNGSKTETYTLASGRYCIGGGGSGGDQSGSGASSYTISVSFSK